MSRTYRRRNGDQSWLGWYRRGHYYKDRFKDFEAFEAFYHSDAYQGMQSTPSWWIHDFMTVPQRQEVRRLERKVLHLVDLEEAPFFPLAKKPHHYYW